MLVLCKMSLAADRLAELPPAFGDFFIRSGRLVASDPLAGGGRIDLSADIPLAGGGRRVKVAENNRALPVSRVYFNYNYFHNAGSARFATAPPAAAFSNGRDLDVNRFTVGWEQALIDGLLSLETRLPLYSRTSLESAGPAAASAGIRGGHIGNLALVAKVLLFENGLLATSGGLAVDTPTGDNARARAGGTEYEIRNETVGLGPFLALDAAPGDLFFFHGFAQLDVPVGGNTIRFTDRDLGTSGAAGIYTEQTLLLLDGSLGAWLYKGAGAPLLAGVASLVEIHYIDTLQNTDNITLSRPKFGGQSTARFRNPANWMNVVNLTAALHAQLAGGSSLRAGYVFPATGLDDKFFDGELAVQAELRY